ncbi:MAG: ATP-dependent DNA helicase RecQ [Chthoniobacterales bacterium]
MTMPDLPEALSRHFGFSEFRSGQEEVIRTLLEGRSALAIFPTGAGKSLCYQLPAILLDGLTLVVSPLLALMKDQVDRLQKIGITAARWDSTMDDAALAEIKKIMADGSLKLLYIAPERFASQDFIRQLRSIKLALLAIDESHCISEWGHNFRPDYLRLAGLSRSLKFPRVLALTATATPGVARDIAKAFRIRKDDRVQTSFYRPNLHLHITPTDSEKRYALLSEKLFLQKNLPAIVYVTHRETSENLATRLSKEGFSAAAYHAGLKTEFRDEIQERFMQGKITIVVATIAFGMGVDKANIRSVFHYNLPKTLENYQQEIGRAGRDAGVSHCEIFACGEDMIPLQNFIFGNTPSESLLVQLVDHFFRQGVKIDISRYELTRAFDIRPAVLDTLLTYLEKAKLLKPSGKAYSRYRLAFQHSEEAVLAGRNPRERRLLKKLFSSGKKGWRWLTIDFDKALEATQSSATILKRLLQDLKNSSDVELQAYGLRESFTLLPAASTKTPREIAKQLQDIFQHREEADLKRLHQVQDLVERRGCIPMRLLRHFGESLPSRCGSCSDCLREKLRAQGKKVQPLKKLLQAKYELHTEDIARIRAVIEQSHPALRSPRALTRFLCGIPSPAISRDRLFESADYGYFRQWPFLDILAQVQTMIRR